MGRSRCSRSRGGTWTCPTLASSWPLCSCGERRSRWGAVTGYDPGKLLIPPSTGTCAPRVSSGPAGRLQVGRRAGCPPRPRLGRRRRVHAAFQRQASAAAGVQVRPPGHRPPAPGQGRTCGRGGQGRPHLPACGGGAAGAAPPAAPAWRWRVCRRPGPLGAPPERRGGGRRLVRGPPAARRAWRAAFVACGGAVR